ncbi:MAG: ABC transporter substrate-binding protein [Armatimonadetes bacterium]|nr:ABC transporter substrate-binding protein [Armatimonadota bacterium]
MGHGVLRALAILAVAAVVAALPQSLSVSAQGRGNILTVALHTWPSTFDPAIGVGGPHYRVFVNIYEGLLAYERGSVKLLPALAQSWSASSDLTTYTFKLRPRVKFHDGTTLDAEAVKWSFDRVRKLNMGPATLLDKVRDVEVADPMTVRIHLKQASATFPMGLPKVYVHGKARARDADDGKAWFAVNLNGTGPFKVVQKEKDQFIVMQRHADYWGGWPERRLEGVLIRIVPDGGTQKLMLQRGELDMANLFSVAMDEHPDSLARKPGIKVVKSPAFRTFIYPMNVQKANSPFRDKRVRKAAALGFNYEGMREVFFGAAAIPNGFLPPGFTAHDPRRPRFVRDLAAARRLLAEAGHSRGFEIEAIVREEEEQGRKLGLILQASLAEVGIKVNIVYAPPQGIMFARIAKLETAPPLGSHLLMSPVTADAGTYLRQVFGSGVAGKPYNHAWYQTPEVDRLLAEAEATGDAQKRISLWRRAENIIIDDQPVIFTSFVTPIVEPVRERVMDYMYHPLDYSGVFGFYRVYVR